MAQVTNEMRVVRNVFASRPPAEDVGSGVMFVATDVAYTGVSDGANWVPSSGQGYGNEITGAETAPRNYVLASSLNGGGSGVIRFCYFTAQKAATVTKAVSATTGTAAGATPTICRVGLWSVASNGDLTLVASTDNDTSLWGSTNTLYETDLGAAYEIAPGQRYAAGSLIVSGAAVPTLAGYPNTSVAGAIGALAPRISGRISGQSDLPSSVGNGDIAVSAYNYWYAFIA